MDFGLTGERQMVVDTVRGFVEKELYPHEEEVERTGQAPPGLGEEIKRKVVDLGFYAPNLPVEVGGGLDHLTFTLLERELGRASMALSVFWGRPSGILMGCEGGAARALHVDGSLTKDRDGAYRPRVSFRRGLAVVPETARTIGE